MARAWAPFVPAAPAVVVAAPPKPVYAVEPPPVVVAEAPSDVDGADVLAMVLIVDVLTGVGL